MLQNAYNITAATWPHNCIAFVSFKTCKYAIRGSKPGVKGDLYPHLSRRAGPAPHAVATTDELKA